MDIGLVLFIIAVFAQGYAGAIVNQVDYLANYDGRKDIYDLAIAYSKTHWGKNLVIKLPLINMTAIGIPKVLKFHSEELGLAKKWKNYRLAVYIRNIGIMGYIVWVIIWEK